MINNEYISAQKLSTSRKLMTFFCLMMLSPLVQSQDKSFERKEVTDTQKKLDIKKEDLADPNKKLDIREGDVTDTKKLLRKTDSMSNTQLALLKQNALKAVGKDAYVYAYSNAPELMKTRFKYDWLKIQVEEEYSYWKGREKREIASKKNSRKVVVKGGGNKKANKSNKNNKGKDGLSETRAKDYEKRYDEYDKKINEYKTILADLDKKIVSMKKGTAEMAGDFAKNTVGNDGARLTDKFGNFLLSLDKGSAVETKNSSLDERYYEVKYKNKVYFGLKQYFTK